MAMRATRRKCEVTSFCAAAESPCSCQRFASMYSCCGSSMGKRRISSRYLARPPLAATDGNELISLPSAAKRRRLWRTRSCFLNERSHHTLQTTFTHLNSWTVLSQSSQEPYTIPRFPQGDRLQKT